MGQENHSVLYLKEDMSILGMKFEGWQKNAEKAGVIPR